jgi:hypothetical protein
MRFLLLNCLSIDYVQLLNKVAPAPFQLLGFPGFRGAGNARGTEPLGPRLMDLDSLWFQVFKDHDHFGPFPRDGTQ